MYRKMNLQEASKELNIDYNTALARFGGSEALYQRFLKKFLQENTYNELEQAWENGNYEEIEKKAHTLKGVAGNLSLENLFSISNELVQAIRNVQYENTQEIYQRLQEEYKHTITVITNMD